MMSKMYIWEFYSHYTFIFTAVWSRGTLKEIRDTTVLNVGTTQYIELQHKAIFRNHLLTTISKVKSNKTI